MNVYIVECGEYSGRYIAAVFAEEALADAYARANDGSVDEFEVETTISEEEQRHLRPGERAYSVGMDVDGSGAQARAMWSTPEERLGVRMRGGMPERFSFSCWASSEEHAIKQLNDRRSAWLSGPRMAGTRNTQAAYSGGSDHGWREAL